MNRELRETLKRLEEKADAAYSRARQAAAKPPPSTGDSPVLWVPTVPVLWSGDMPDLLGGQGHVTPPLYTQSGPYSEVLLKVESHSQTLWLQAQRPDGMVSNRVQIAWTRKGLTS